VSSGTSCHLESGSGTQRKPRPDSARIERNVLFPAAMFPSIAILTAMEALSSSSASGKSRFELPEDHNCIQFIVNNRNYWNHVESARNCASQHASCRDGMAASASSSSSSSSSHSIEAVQAAEKALPRKEIPEVVQRAMDAAALAATDSKGAIHALSEILTKGGTCLASGAL
jgi:hypothetical protein